MCFVCFVCLLQGQGTTEHVIEAPSAAEMKGWLQELQYCITPLQPPDGDLEVDLSPAV